MIFKTKYLPNHIQEADDRSFGSFQEILLNDN